jgi:hypothetical protein
VGPTGGPASCDGVSLITVVRRWVSGPNGEDLEAAVFVAADAYRGSRSMADTDALIAALRRAFGAGLDEVAGWTPDQLSALEGRRAHERLVATERAFRVAKASYEKSHDRADLDRAFELAEEALATAPRSGPTRVDRLSALVWSLAARWLLDRDRADLDRAIGLAEGALARTQEQDQRRLTLGQNVNWCLAERWKLDHDRADLERAVEVAEELLSLTSPGDPDRATRQENLHWWLGERSLLDRDRDDLDRATGLAEEALTPRPKDDLERPDGTTSWPSA